MRERALVVESRSVDSARQDCRGIRRAREAATVEVRDGADGLGIVAAAYRLAFGGAGFATLADAAGEPWAHLRLDFALDILNGRDFQPDSSARRSADGTGDRPRLVEASADRALIAITLESAVWTSKQLVLECFDDRLEIRGEVSGSGAISDCTLLGAQGGPPGSASTPLFDTVFSPEPTAPPRLTHAPTDSSSIDVVSASYPRAGHWFFTPPPFCFGFARNGGRPDPRSGDVPAEPWLMVGLATTRNAHTYSAFGYEGAADGFALRLSYEGQTRVAGRFATPSLVFLFGADDPYEGIARHTSLLRARGLADPPATEPAAWWRRPIFCGWGEQVWLARQRAGGSERYWLGAPELSRQDLYDGFLATLSEAGVHPGTVVVDDKWQRQYALPEPDPAKWPDMRGWIARRHDEGRRVLLWWNSWGAEGLPEEQAVRDPDGRAVTVDPSNPAYEAHLRGAIEEMLDPGGLDADGFKVDFTANTPTGAQLSHHGREWGVELLRTLVATIHDAAHATKRDALVMTHTPNPYFAAVSDMIRLNDILRLEDGSPDYPVLGEMRHRERIARAACPELLIDTDNWPCPTKAAWREYVSMQPDLGVPSLYYATHIDISGEPLGQEDYALVREAWNRYEGTVAAAGPASAGPRAAA